MQGALFAETRRQSLSCTSGKSPETEARADLEQDPVTEIGAGACVDRCCLVDCKRKASSYSLVDSLADRKLRVQSDHVGSGCFGQCLADNLHTQQRPVDPSDMTSVFQLPAVQGRKLQTVSADTGTEADKRIAR